MRLKKASPEYRLVHLSICLLKRCCRKLGCSEPIADSLLAQWQRLNGLRLTRASELVTSAGNLCICEHHLHNHTFDTGDRVYRQLRKLFPGRFDAANHAVDFCDTIDLVAAMGKGGERIVVRRIIAKCQFDAATGLPTSASIVNQRGPHDLQTPEYKRMSEILHSIIRRIVAHNRVPITYLCQEDEEAEAAAMVDNDDDGDEEEEEQEDGNGGGAEELAP